VGLIMAGARGSAVSRYAWRIPFTVRCAGNVRRPIRLRRPARTGRHRTGRIPIDRDDVGVVVRRATLRPRLRPHTRRRSASSGQPTARCGWRICRSADRLAQSGDRRRERELKRTSFVRHAPLVAQPRRGRPRRCSPRFPPGQLTEDDRARFAFPCGPANMLWVLADPGAREKSLIDDASRTTARRRLAATSTRSSRLYWFAVDQPGLATQASGTGLRWTNLARRCRRRDCLGARRHWPPMRGAPPKRWPSRTRDTPFATRSFDAPADAVQHRRCATSARCCCPAGSPRPSRWPSGCAHQAGRSPWGRRTCSVLRWRGRAALGAGNLDTACSMLEQAAVAVVRCGSRHRLGIPVSLPSVDCSPPIRGANGRGGPLPLVALDELRRPFPVAGTTERSLARAWLAAGPGRRQRRGSAILLSALRKGRSEADQFAAEVSCLQTATQFGDRSGRPAVAGARGNRRGATRRSCGPVRRGPARRADAAELAAVSEDFERMATSSRR